MINIQFKLKNPKSDQKTSIRCTFYHNKERFIYSLGEDKTIYPILWDDENMRPINSKKKEYKSIIHEFKGENFNIENELININQRIENVANEVQKFISHMEFQNKPLLFTELKNHLNGIFYAQKSQIAQKHDKRISLNDYITKFIQEIGSGERTYTSAQGEKRHYKPTSVKVYKEFKTQFATFQNARGKYDFKDINMDFYNKYTAHFAKKDYKTNSIGKQIKCLKTILSAALDEGIHYNDSFQKKDFKTLKTDVHNVYLDIPELDLLEEIDLSGKPHLEQARDVFLCGCYTALRFSDYKRINHDFIIVRDGKYFIDMITQKTGYRVVIPIKPIIFEILKKYNFTLPNTYEQKVNKYIKEVAEMCGINSLIEIKENIGSKVTSKFVPKYQLIMTHTARRTGATLLYKFGVPTLDIMKITGHKTEKNLLNYIKINVEENADRLKDNPFFR